MGRALWICCTGIAAGNQLGGTVWVWSSGGCWPTVRKIQEDLDVRMRPHSHKGWSGSFFGMTSKGSFLCVVRVGMASTHWRSNVPISIRALVNAHKNFTVIRYALFMTPKFSDELQNTHFISTLFFSLWLLCCFMSSLNNFLFMTCRQNQQKSMIISIINYLYELVVKMNRSLFYDFKIPAFF